MQHMHAETKGIREKEILREREFKRDKSERNMHLYTHTHAHTAEENDGIASKIFHVPIEKKNGKGKQKVNLGYVTTNQDLYNHNNNNNNKQ